MRRLGLLFLASGLSIGLLLAQQAWLAGPVEGFTFDLPTQSFRAVIGLPGSSLFGPALASGFDAGSVAPRANYGIAFRQSACLLVSGLGSGVVSTNPLNGANGQPEGITWAADGSAAVLFSRTGNWLQLLNGLPNAPQFGPAVDVAALGGSLAAVAVDQHGGSVALAVQGEQGGIFLSSDGQSFTALLQMSLPRALAFSEDGRALYVLDGGSPQMILLTVGDGSVQAMALDGLQDAFAVASGRDLQSRELIYIADRQDQILRLYDPAAQQVVIDLALDFRPTAITPLGAHSYVLASRAQANDPLWILAGAPVPAVYFVPAAQAMGGVE